MSVDTMFKARRFTSNARLMSRMALIASGQTYPYDDKESVLSRVKEFLEVALKEGHFLGSDGQQADVCESHFDPLQPIKLSAKALHKESVMSDIADLDQQLTSILEAVNSLEKGQTLSEEDIQKNKEFFLSLQDNFDALSNDELLETVAMKASEMMYVHGY